VVGVCDETVDGGPEIDNGSKDATFEPPSGELGEGAFHGMISLVPMPPQLSRTILARHTCWAALRLETSAKRRRRSDGETLKKIPVRMGQTRTRNRPRESP